MAITLGTNISSLKITNGINNITTALADSMERLSSGLKINSAKDDAAGLVISENMQARIQSSEQAMQNIQTSEAFLTVAEDGMVSITDHLQRINDLLTNMANDTNDIDSRTASANEIVERLEEIDRLASSTNFNGMKMLDGSTDSIIVQLGPDSTEDSILEIAGALSNCYTSAQGLNIILPDELNPNAFDNAGQTVYLQDDGTYVDNTGATVTIGDPSTLTQRGLLGAYGNRLESSYDSLSIRVESLKEGQSVYTDTDVAKESTNYVRQQILEQLNVSLLTQSNSTQQLALSLLGG